MAYGNEFGFHGGEMARIYFITGTGTGVGKTILTALLVKRLCQRGINAAALKPICSGGRGDARKLFAAMNGILSLDRINPWHFRAPLAPLLAARREDRKLKLPQVMAHLRKMQKHFDVLLVEGAGGLLSPLGELFNSRDLILALDAMPVIVAPNKLGVVNQILLTLEALPKNVRTKTIVVLMAPAETDAATGSNAKLLKQLSPKVKIFTLPRLGTSFSSAKTRNNSVIRSLFKAIFPRAAIYFS